MNEDQFNALEDYYRNVILKNIEDIKRRMLADYEAELLTLNDLSSVSDEVELARREQRKFDIKEFISHIKFTL